MGVNALAVNSGTDMEITVQLSDLVTRNIPKELPEGKQIVENPALHLTAAYFMQELRKQEQPQMTEELKELQEELLAHYGKGTFLIPVEENGQIPILKQKTVRCISLFLRMCWNFRSSRKEDRSDRQLFRGKRSQNC